MSRNQATGKGELAFCSIVPRDHLPRARALAASVHAHHPGARMFVLLLDPPESRLRPGAEPFTTVPLDELKLAGLPGLCFRHTAAELARAVRPHLLAHLLGQRGVRKLVSLDADVEMLAQLGYLGRLLERRPVIITPSLTSPLDPAGTDGPGLIALAAGPAANTFLAAWEQQPDGKLPRASGSEGAWIDPATGRLRRRVPLPGAGLRYAWAYFNNGVAIPDLARRLYRGLGPSAAAYDNPFATAGRHTFYSWLTSFDGPALPPLVQALYQQRSDVRNRFPDVVGKDRMAFLEWLVSCGQAEYHLDPALLAPVRVAIGQPFDGLEELAGGRFQPAVEAFGVNVLGFMHSEKGVGEACRTTIRALTAAGVPLVLNNWVELGSSNADASLAEFSCENPYPVNLVHVNADGADHAAQRIPWYFRDRYNIGFWNWELEWFPEKWCGSFEYFNEIWAPSTFTQESIARVSPVPVYRIPYAITLPPSPPGSLCRERFGLPRDAFVFLFAFDFHSYLARKNPMAAIEAFRRAFAGRRDVVLALKTSRCEHTPLEFAEFLAACRGQANIRILRQVMPREDMLALLRVCDAYVALHRSEGFGLPLAEAMAAGKPVVATNYSANVDFMTESNSFPVRYTRVAIDTDHGPYRRGAVWADPDVEHAAEQMRRLVDTPGLAAQVGARARADVERTLSPQAVGRLVQRRMTAILGDRKASATTARTAAA